MPVSPSALVPIRLPSTTLAFPPSSQIPVRLAPIALRAAAAGPPMRLLPPPITLIPDVQLPSATVPPASSPTWLAVIRLRLPSTTMPSDWALCTARPRIAAVGGAEVDRALHVGPVDRDPQHGGGAGGRGGAAGLAETVEVRPAGDDRERRDRRDRVHAGAGDRERDTVGSRRGVGVVDGAAQGAGAAVGGRRAR